MRTWLTLPNLFTLARLLLAPVIVCAILNRRAFAALAIFAVAAATDVIDGYLARQFGAATAAGAVLRPLPAKPPVTRGLLGPAAGGRVPRSHRRQATVDRCLPGAGAGRQRTLVAGRRDLRTRPVNSCSLGRGAPGDEITCVSAQYLGQGQYFSSDPHGGGFSGPRRFRINVSGRIIRRLDLAHAGADGLEWSALRLAWRTALTNGLTGVRCGSSLEVDGFEE